MRVEENVRDHPALGEGHVLAGYELGEDAFLTMTRSELVSDDRVPVDAESDGDFLRAGDFFDAFTAQDGNLDDDGCQSAEERALERRGKNEKEREKKQRKEREKKEKR